MDDNALSWDGSSLGTIKHKEIIKDGPYWQFAPHPKERVECESQVCRVFAKIDRNSLYCLLDESLPDFGFAKFGTATVRIGNTSYTCVNFDFRGHTPLVITEKTQVSLRERAQLYITLRWAFSVPVDPKKELFFLGSKLHGKYNEIERENEGHPQEVWFPLTIEEARRKLTQGREFERIMRNVASRIERINRGAFPYLAIIRSRLISLGV